MLGFQASSSLSPSPSKVPGSKQRKFPLEECYHCVNDLLPCSKFLQQHTTINIYYLHFCGSGTLEWLSHMVLAQGVSLGCRLDISQGCIIWRLNWGWRISFQDGSLGAGKKPYKVASGFPQREWHTRKQGGSLDACCDLLCWRTPTHHSQFIEKCVSPNQPALMEGS